MFGLVYYYAEVMGEFSEDRFLDKEGLSIGRGLPVEDVHQAVRFEVTAYELLAMCCHIRIAMAHSTLNSMLASV